MSTPWGNRPARRGNLVSPEGLSQAPRGRHVDPTGKTAADASYGVRPLHLDAQFVSKPSLKRGKILAQSPV